MMQEAAINSNVIPMPLAEQPRNLLDMPRCTFTTVGLIIERGMPIDDWVELGKRLAKAKDSLGIWRGDWIEYGKHEYGKKYAAALEMTGLKPGTLRNDVWVANAIPLSLRSDKLTSRHYKELAPLKRKNKIQMWVERAVQGDGRKAWSASRLRKEIIRALSPTARTETKGSDSSTSEPKQPPVLSKAAREFLDDYIGELARWSEKIPLALPSSEYAAVQSMVFQHGAQARNLKKRTLDTDCNAIVKVVKDTEDASHTGEMAAADVYDWLTKLGYFMDQEEFRQRLEYMSREDIRKALLTNAGEDGKLEDSRGMLPGIVCVPWSKLRVNKRKRDEDDDEF
jgi:hypothetical protein